MITVSPAFEAAMKAPVKTLRVEAWAYASKEDEDPEQIWYDDLQSIDLNSVGQFLGAGSKKITANVVNDQSAQIGVGVRIDLKVLIPNGSYETISIGRYTVSTVEYTVESNMSKVELFDPMYVLSQTDYSLTNEQFPMTVKQLAEAVCEVAGTTLDSNFDNLPNKGYLIKQNPWATIQNTSYRNVVQEIAQTTGTTAIVSNGTMLFKQFDTPVYTITEDNLTKFKLGDKYGNVNSVSLSRMPQNDNILLRDDVDVEENGLYEITIINNQIVDDDRQLLIQPLYAELVNGEPYIGFYNAEFKTEGHGWYEVGDLITANLGGVDYPVFITEVVLRIANGISETIKSITPNDPAVNVTTAGGILKTLWNTEIKVDKQNNEIISVVERQRVFEEQTEEDFTRLEQDINNIQLSVQNGGGVNQIKNSVGYSSSTVGGLTFWDKTGAATIEPSIDTNSLVAGALSGNRIDFIAGPGAITQRVTLSPGGTHNLTFYAKKNTQGVARVSLTNDNDNFFIELEDDTEYEWGRFVINDFVPTTNYVDVTIEIDGDVALFSITDLMLSKGAVPMAWQQAVGEVANTNVTFDTTGITVKSNVYEGARTVMSPIEFAGYDSKGDRAFAVNNDTTEVNNFEVRGDIDTSTHRIVFIASGPNAGMNFVQKG